MDYPQNNNTSSGADADIDAQLQRLRQASDPKSLARTVNIILIITTLIIISHK